MIPIDQILSDILSWIFVLNIPVKFKSNTICLVLLGLVCLPLIFLSLREFVIFLSGRRNRRPLPNERTLAAAVIIAPLIFIDLVFSVFGFHYQYFIPAVCLVMSFSLGIFELCLFMTACLSVRSRKTRPRITGAAVFFICILSAGLFFPLPLLVLEFPSLFFPAVFSLLVCFVCIGFALARLAHGREHRYFLAAAAQMFVIALSLSFPSAELQIIMRSIPVLFMLIFWKTVLNKKLLYTITIPDEDETSRISALKYVDLERQDKPAAGENAEELEELEPADEYEFWLPDSAATDEGAFIPREFLNLLDKKSVGELKPGEFLQREMTILFSGIRQYNDMFSGSSPEEGFNSINSHLACIAPAIEQFGGFIYKYTGDAVMALFPQPNGPDMAVLASLEIQNRIGGYNRSKLKGYCPPEIDIGVHTGTIILGVVGVHDRLQTTVVSDAVKIAGRVEGLSRAFGVSLAISSQTFVKLEHPEDYMYRYIGNVKLKEKDEPVCIYEILNSTDKNYLDKKMASNRLFEQGLFAFVQKEYEEAMDNFTAVLGILPDDLAAKTYLDYCKEKLAAGNNE